MKKLENILKRAAKATDKRNIMPLLECVLIKPCEGGVEISATNLEVGYQATVGGITINGPACVELKKLRDLNKAMKGIASMVVLDDHSLKLVNGNADATVTGFDPEDFPLLPEEIDLVEYIEVPLDELKRVAKAMSKDETRYNLNGVYVDPKGKLVCTDGHRLHFADIEGVGKARPTIIPSGTVKILEGFKAEKAYVKKIFECDVCGTSSLKPFDKLSAADLKEVKKARLKADVTDLKDHYYNKMKPFKDDEGNELFDFYSEQLTDGQKADVRKDYLKAVSVEAFYEKHPMRCTECKQARKDAESDRRANIFWFDGDEQLMSRDIEGEFPDYEQVIPSEVSFTYTIDRDTISDAVKQLLPIADPKTKGIKVHLGDGGNNISTVNPDIGEMTVKLEGKFENRVVDPCDGCKSADECQDKAPCDRHMKYRAKALDFGLNANYLLDILSDADDEITFKFVDVLSACRIGEAIIMPMRL